MSRKRPTENPEQNDLALVLTSEDEILFTRSEKNLVDIGYYGAHDPRTRPTRREIHIGKAAGITKITLEAPERLGLPSITDHKFWDGFTELCYEKRTREGIVTNPIKFTGAQLLAKMQRPRNGESYGDISTWGQRLNSTTIITSGPAAIYHKRQKAFIETSEHLFTKFTRAKGEKSGNQHNTVYSVELVSWALDNLNDMYVIRKDAAAQRKLQRSMAFSLFNALHIWFYASKGAPIERDYSGVCNRFGVPEYKYKAKIEDTMGRSLDELQSIGYLAKWSVVRMSSKDGFKVCMEAGLELLRILRMNQKRVLEDSNGRTVTIEDSPVMLDLLALGISKSVAVELQKLGTEEEMLDRIDYVNSLIAKKGDALHNPAGFAISALRDGVVVPHGFVTSRKRREIVEKNRLEREKQQQELLTTLAYAEWCQDRVTEAIKLRFTGEELEVAAKAKLPQMLADYPTLRRVDRTKQLETARKVLEREIRDELNLPTEDQWGEMDKFKNVQASLFVLEGEKPVAPVC